MIPLEHESNRIAPAIYFKIVGLFAPHDNSF